MDEYTYEIWTSITGDWAIVPTATPRVVTAYTESEAVGHAERFADQNFGAWKIKNLKFSRKFTNPDNEI